MNRHPRRIVFVNPPLTRRERYGRLAAAGNILPPHAFLNLGAWCRRIGWDVHVIDGQAERIDAPHIAARVRDLDPLAVGVTATTMSLFRAAEVAACVKRDAPDRPTILGGPHVTAVPEETLRMLPSFDVAVLGEGEETLEELLGVLETRGLDPAALARVRGIAFRGAPLGEAGGSRRETSPIATTPPRPLLDMRRLPPMAWDLLPGYPRRYRPASTYLYRTPFSDLVVSRGCPFRCTFCDQAIFGHTERCLSFGQVRREIETMACRHGIRSIFFTDDDFMGHTEVFRETCEWLCRARLDLVWSINARLGHVKPDLLRLMKAAGCWQISYGVESGSRVILKHIRKGAGPRLMEQSLRWTREAAIRSNAYIILGLPGETRETLEETRRFLRRVPIDTLRVSYFTPFPGAEASRDLERHGTVGGTWKDRTFYQVAFVPKDLTAADLGRAYKTLMREFYLRPEVLRSFLPLLTSWGNVWRLAQGGWSFVRLLASREKECAAQAC